MELSFFDSSVELMITRINFVEKPPLEFTYANLLAIAGGLLLLVSLFAGSTFLKVKWNTARITFLQSEIARLNAERDQILKDKKPDTTGPVSEIGSQLEKSIPWSTVLNDLSRRLSEKAWLTGLTATDDGKNTGMKKLELKGEAQSPEAVTKTIKNWGSSPYLQDLSLKSAEEQTGLFTFVANASLRAGPQKK